MLNNRNTIAAIIVAIACFAFFALVLTGYDNIKAAKGFLAERQTKLDERKALVEKVAAMNAQYEENADRIDKLDQMLPTEKHEDEIISSIQTIAAQAGLVVSEMTLSELQDPSKPYKSSQLNILLIGQYEKFFAFLQLTEQSLRLYDIQGFNISEAMGSNIAPGSLLFQIKAITNNVNVTKTP